jgi:hypothetical protein
MMMNLRSGYRNGNLISLSLKSQFRESMLNIVNVVQQNNNSEAETEKFLSGADPWVIAHSIVSGDRIVTHEKRVPNNSKKIKIPNICEIFDAPVCLDTYQLMRALGATL